MYKNLLWKCKRNNRITEKSKFSPYNHVIKTFWIFHIFCRIFGQSIMFSCNLIYVNFLSSSQGKWFFFIFTGPSPSYLIDYNVFSFHWFFFFFWTSLMLCLARSSIPLIKWYYDPFCFWYEEIYLAWSFIGFALLENKFVI